jgi:hypothetical protein
MPSVLVNCRKTWTISVGGGGGGGGAKHGINHVLQAQLNASCMQTFQNAVPQSQKLTVYSYYYTQQTTSFICGVPIVCVCNTYPDGPTSC